MPGPLVAKSAVSRRAVLLAAPFVLAGCVSTTRTLRPAPGVPPKLDPVYLAMYGPRPDEKFPLPATDISQVKPQFLRQEVVYPTSEPVGTIVVDTPDRFLYLVRPDGMAMRYGIGVGREGFAWAGDATIQRKAVWPRWTPPAEMVARDEKAAKWAGGMPGGLDNPLGARALYLYQGGRDTLYRIHGTNEPYSIGSNVSSGCIRLINQDIIDLYERIPVGTRVVVVGPSDGFLADTGKTVREGLQSMTQLL